MLSHRFLTYMHMKTHFFPLSCSWVLFSPASFKLIHVQAYFERLQRKAKSLYLSSKLWTVRVSDLSVLSALSTLCLLGLGCAGWLVAWLVEIESFTATQAGLQNVIWLKLTSDSQGSSCLSFSTAGIPGTSHHCNNELLFLRSFFLFEMHNEMFINKIMIQCLGFSLKQYG